MGGTEHRGPTAVFSVQCPSHPCSRLGKAATALDVEAGVDSRPGGIKAFAVTLALPPARPVPPSRRALGAVPLPVALGIPVLLARLPSVSSLPAPEHLEHLGAMWCPARAGNGLRTIPTWLPLLPPQRKTESPTSSPPSLCTSLQHRWPCWAVIVSSPSKVSWMFLNKRQMLM